MSLTINEIQNKINQLKQLLYAADLDNFLHLKSFIEDIMKNLPHFTPDTNPAIAKQKILLTNTEQTTDPIILLTVEAYEIIRLIGSKSMHEEFIRTVLEQENIIADPKDRTTLKNIFTTIRKSTPELVEAVSATLAKTVPLTTAPKLTVTKAEIVSKAAKVAKAKKVAKSKKVAKAKKVAKPESIMTPTVKPIMSTHPKSATSTATTVIKERVNTVTQATNELHQNMGEEADVMIFDLEKIQNSMNDVQTQSNLPDISDRPTARQIVNVLTLMSSSLDDMNRAIRRLFQTLYSESEADNMWKKFLEQTISVPWIQIKQSNDKAPLAVYRYNDIREGSVPVAAVFSSTTANNNMIEKYNKIIEDEERQAANSPSSNLIQDEDAIMILTFQTDEDRVNIMGELASALKRTIELSKNADARANFELAMEAADVTLTINKPRTSPEAKLTTSTSIQLKAREKLLANSVDKGAIDHHIPIYFKSIYRAFHNIPDIFTPQPLPLDNVKKLLQYVYHNLLMFRDQYIHLFKILNNSNSEKMIEQYKKTKGSFYYVHLKVAQDPNQATLYDYTAEPTKREFVFNEVLFGNPSMIDIYKTLMNHEANNPPQRELIKESDNKYIFAFTTLTNIENIAREFTEPMINIIRSDDIAYQNFNYAQIMTNIRLMTPDEKLDDIKKSLSQELIGEQTKPIEQATEQPSIKQQATAQSPSMIKNVAMLSLRITKGAKTDHILKALTLINNAWYQMNTLYGNYVTTNKEEVIALLELMTHTLDVYQNQIPILLQNIGPDPDSLFNKLKSRSVTFHTIGIRPNTSFINNNIYYLYDQDQQYETFRIEHFLFRGTKEEMKYDMWLNSIGQQTLSVPPKFDFLFWYRNLGFLEADKPKDINPMSMYNRRVPAFHTIELRREFIAAITTMLIDVLRKADETTQTHFRWACVATKSQFMNGAPRLLSSILVNLSPVIIWERKLTNKLHGTKNDFLKHIKKIRSLMEPKEATASGRTNTTDAAMNNLLSIVHKITHYTDAFTNLLSIIDSSGNILQRYLEKVISLKTMFVILNTDPEDNDSVYQYKHATTGTYQNYSIKDIVTLPGDKSIPVFDIYKNMSIDEINHSAHYKDDMKIVIPDITLPGEKENIIRQLNIILVSLIRKKKNADAKELYDLAVNIIAAKRPTATMTSSVQQADKLIEPVKT